MRISDTMLSQSYLRNIFNSKKRMEKMQTQLATGTKISKPSDSPAGAAKLMRLNNTIKNSESYKNNIGEGLASLKETSDGLEGMVAEIQALRGMYPESYANKIGLSIDSLINIANKEYNGKYLFGGTDSSQKPYGFTTDESAIELKVPDVSGEHKVKISNNITQKINITGDELFGTMGTDDIFNTLKRIKDDLISGNLPSDADKQLVEDFHSTLLDVSSKVGIYTNRLYDSEELLNNRILTLKELMSDETEVDVVETMVDLEHQDYLLQLAYKTSAQILPKSLVDYL